MRSHASGVTQHDYFRILPNSLVCIMLCALPLITVSYFFNKLNPANCYFISAPVHRVYILALSLPESRMETCNVQLVLTSEPVDEILYTKVQIWRTTRAARV